MCRTQLTTHCVLLSLFRPAPITHPAQIKPHEHLRLPTPPRAAVLAGCLLRPFLFRARRVPGFANPSLLT